MTGFNSKKAMANDRMAELIKEATALAWVDRVARGPVPMYAEEHMIKLAELIVRECAEICLEANDHKNILRHFGVELDVNETLRNRSTYFGNDI
jgi:hypothetical protein